MSDYFIPLFVAGVVTVTLVVAIAMRGHGKSE